jgi:hypothetical protein
MNMRTFSIAALVLIASFGTPLLASAQSCTTEGASCSYNGNTGTCVSVQVGTDTVLSCNASSGGGVQTNPGSNSLQTNPGSTGNTGSNVTLINPLQGGTSLESFLNNILAFVIRIGTIVVILMLVYVGYLFVVARGEPAKITEARSALLWTVVGALILLGAQAIAIGITATVKALSVGG